jgi:hypothetical protein
MAAGLGALQPSAAYAFSQPIYYPRAAAAGGGGGRWFTSSPNDGFGCAVCHTGEGSFPVHVQGLPTTGYVPGTRYDVRVTWPEFSARADAIRQTTVSPAATPGLEPTLSAMAGPDMSVVAEFSTETGVGGGALEMEYATIASPERSDEWCAHLQGVPASQLFDTSAAKADAPVMSCDPKLPGQRCLLAVQVCGARTLRFVWTAPAADIGPIWFTAGLVATDHLSADPTQDSVTQVQQPLFPASSAGSQYVTTLNHGCSAAQPSVRGNTSLFSLPLVCGLVRLRRRRYRKSSQRPPHASKP